MKLEMRRWKQMNLRKLELIIKLRRMRWRGHLDDSRLPKHAAYWESKCKEDEERTGWISRVKI